MTTSLLQRLVLALFVITTTVLTASALAAQELEPRSYAPAPTGTTFLIGGLGRSQGPILMDASLDVDNVEGDLWVATPGLGHVFGLAGRQARLLAVAPVAWGAVEGDVHGQGERQDLAGLVDPRVTVSVNLRGARALTPSEFARAPHARTVVGASVTIVPPLGQYASSQLVNLGFNRWAVKPELGVSHQLARWTIEWYAGLWLFSTNRSYFPGNAVKRQDAVFAAQAHASYSLPRRTWLAFNGTWFVGGQTRIDETVSPDEQRNTRLGATYSFPLSAGQSLKVAYSTGASTRRGSAFNTFTISWQLVRLRTL